MAQKKSDNQTAVATQEYIYKSIDKPNNKITCLDNDFNTVTFDLDASNKDLLSKINQAIADGQNQNKDVTIIVTNLQKGNKQTKTVSDVKIAGDNDDNDDDDDAKWPEDAADDDEKKENENNNDISVRIAPATKMENNVQNVVFELCGSVDKGRCPIDICCVLDVSGSMSASAAVKEDDGTVKNDDGLSVLDLVKHSVKTVMHCLEKNDRFSIVTFSGEAAMHYDLSFMTDRNMKEAETKLSQLNASGQTNIWAGLHVGMDCLKKKQEIGRLSVIMLLTDGQPNKSPQKGEIFEINKYIDMTNFAVQINTFGFGYNLDSKLLHNIAVNGNGTYAFIPDSKIVGTTFVNSVANILTTISAETKLHLTAVNGSKFVGKSYGAHNEQDESWGRIIDVGPIMCGSTRYISVPMSIPKQIAANQPFVECMIRTQVLGARGKYNKMNINGIQKTVANDLYAGHLTAKVVSIGLEITDLNAVGRYGKIGQTATTMLEELKKEIKKANDIAQKTDTDDFAEMTANSRLEALNNDVQGRFNKSFQGKARFNRWGKHYLRALLRAHQLNMCTNFMDPGLQVNGGNLFRELRAKGDEVFINLPAPKPSRRVCNYNNNNYNNNNNNNNNNAVDMTNYYGGVGGGCFGPHCTVITMDNNTKQYICKQICDIKPGDMVKVVNETFAKVLFVIELARNKKRRMIELPGGLIITGGHPIRRNGIWCVPKQQNDALITKGCDKVYTFVLDKGHVMIVNGIECVTWGHGINYGIVKNEFYGTDKVVKALKQKALDMENGMVERCGAENGNMLDNVVAIYQ